MRNKLTWDSTVIDDDDDASGEGLMQRDRRRCAWKGGGWKTQAFEVRRSGRQRALRGIRNGQFKVDTLVAAAAVEKKAGRIPQDCGCSISR